jgi:hypothetical protein
MSDDGQAQQVQDVPRFQRRATADSHFSWMRTRLSLERTMPWPSR